MEIKAAVLRKPGAPRPYRDSLPVSFETIELSEPEEHEVLVQVEVASLCHSDLSVVNGTRVRPTPMVIGHEASGRVLDVGPGVTSVKKGDRVCFTFQPACGKCELCKTTSNRRCSEAFEANQKGTLLFGKQHLSSGSESLAHHTGVSAFAQAAVVHESSVIPVAEDVPYEIAALIACAVTTGGGAVKNAGKLVPGERVAVIGGGGVGIAALLVANALGASETDLIDPAEAKHDTFRDFGASNVHLPGKAPEASYDLVIEAAGVGPALQSALNLVKPGGRVVTVGMPSPETEIRVNVLDLVFQSKSLIGSYQGSGNVAEDVADYIQLWREGRLPLEKLISSRLELEDLNEALDAMSDAVGIRHLVKIGSVN